MLLRTIWQVAIHTPWWVYVLFGYVLKIGFDATKARVISFRRLFILPTLFFFMSLRALIISVRPSAITVGIYLLSLLFGIAGGTILAKSRDLQFDKAYGLIKLPGSYATLILTLIIFLAKYYFGYALSIDPSRAQDTTFEICMLGVSGICAGLFLGRLVYYLYKKQSAPHCGLR